MDKVINYLKTEWQKIIRAFNLDEQISETHFNFIYEAYSSKSRFYHNTEHVSSILTHINAFEKMLADANILRLATFYHDVIYTVGFADNEEKSAQFAEKHLLELKADEKIIYKTAALIRATKTHTLPQEFENDFDSKFFIDCDLAILGSDLSDYKKYTQAIRKEYSSVHQLFYRAGRQSVLKNFLKMPHIYKTVEMRNLFEGKARKNIENELEELQASPNK